jgi:hypothetical protein
LQRLIAPLVTLLLVPLNEPPRYLLVRGVASLLFGLKKNSVRRGSDRQETSEILVDLKIKKV